MKQELYKLNWSSCFLKHFACGKGEKRETKTKEVEFYP